MTTTCFTLYLPQIQPDSPALPPSLPQAATLMPPDTVSVQSGPAPETLATLGASVPQTAAHCLVSPQVLPPATAVATLGAGKGPVLGV